MSSDGLFSLGMLCVKAILSEYPCMLLKCRMLPEAVTSIELRPVYIQFSTLLSRSISHNANFKV